MKIAFFRFYEELNDYLPEEKHKSWFEYPFEDEISLQSAIQSLGVPPAEIDLILVNQKSEGYPYILHDGDRISVYPVFEIFDISGISKVRDIPLRNTRFICDVHLGKLCKYLRMLGFDTLYANHYTPAQIMDIALKEKRIILSRNYSLIKDKKVTRAYWIRSSGPLEQIRDVIHRLDLSNTINPLTLCLACNNPLAPIDKQKIHHRIQAKTAEYYHEFYICTNCDNIFWKGSHYDNMLEYIHQNIIR